MANKHLEIVFSQTDGRLYGIKDIQRNVEFIKNKSAWWSPYDFTLRRGGQDVHVYGGLSGNFRYEKRNRADGITLSLSWTEFVAGGRSINVKVGITVDLDDDSSFSRWAIKIDNNDDLVLSGIDFPSLSGLGRISSNPEQDYLALPGYSGLLIQNPLENTCLNMGWGWEMYHPSAYCTMQFMAVYGSKPKSGLYLSSDDSGFSSKFFDVSRPAADWLHLKIRHVPEYVVGRNFSPGSSVIGVFSGDWYDAAQIYRDWALRQEWAGKGPLSSRNDIPAWYRSIGLKEWIYTHPLNLEDVNRFEIVPEVAEDLSAYMDAPVLMNWIGWERSGWYIEYPDVFPPKEGWTEFRRAISNVHRSGNRIRFLPNVTSYSEIAPTWSQAKPSACRDLSGEYFQPFPYAENEKHTRFIKMCPATGFWRVKLRSLLATLSREKADEIHLDGFPVFGPLPCAVAAHNHEKGGGDWWVPDYLKIFGDFKESARKTNPDLALSSEGMAEAYIPLLDSFENPFTTGWSPLSLKAVLKDISKARLIPLWHAVYHDYAFLESMFSFVSRFGPTGAEGYGNDRDFYLRGFALGFVWGELPSTWYCDEKISELDEPGEREVADYLRRLVKARLTFAKPYLMHGRMLRPPELNVPSFRIRGAKRIPYSQERVPPFDSPSVLGSAWKSAQGGAALVLTNISPDRISFSQRLTPRDLDIDGDLPCRIDLVRNGRRSLLKKGVHLPVRLSIQVSPLDVLLIEILPERK
ncbi:MAG: hypothetical protein JW736_01135 [Deltaproteobacteria bacterium]|nr:hypothetical protein [Deltaproteobacteria bacterium]